MPEGSSTSPLRSLVFASGQVGLASNHTRRMTDADRRLDGSTVMALKGFATWALAHDFAPGATAEVSLDGRRCRPTLNVDEIVDPPTPPRSQATRIDAGAKADARTPTCPMTS